MTNHTTQMTSEARREASSRRRDGAHRMRAREESGQRAPVLKRIELIPVYVWDELEPAQVRERSEWHDPRQPGVAVG
jgi:hypothetical protein